MPSINYEHKILVLSCELLDEIVKIFWGKVMIRDCLSSFPPLRITYIKLEMLDFVRLHCPWS